MEIPEGFAVTVRITRDYTPAGWDKPLHVTGEILRGPDRRVARFLLKGGYAETVDNRRGTHAQTLSRVREAAKLRAKGKTLAEIGSQWGISRERARQYLLIAGLIAAQSPAGSSPGGPSSSGRS